MPKAKDFTPEDQVKTPRPTERPPLSPDGNDAEWKENLDAGHENGPTTMHQEKGWRADKLSKP